MLQPAYAQDEHVTELGNKFNPVKIKGLNIPYFGGGPEEETVRTTVFKKQIALLEKANKLRPSVEDYMIALNVQLLHLQRFSDYRKHWLKTFPKQDDPRALNAAKDYVERVFHNECLKTIHFAEDVQDLLGFEFYSKVIAINPYSRVIPIASQNVKDYGGDRQIEEKSPSIKDYKQPAPLWRPLGDHRASIESERVPDKSKQFAIKKVSQSELEEHYKEQHELREREREVKQLRNRNGEKVMPWKDLLPYGSREWNLRN